MTAIRWRTLTFLLVGMAGAMLFAGSLGPAVHPHGAHSAHGAHGHSHGAGTLARPAGIVATFAGTSAVCWLVSRRRGTGGPGRTRRSGAAVRAAAGCPDPRRAAR